MAKIDDSVKKKVPELRFKGFTDPWVQRKFGELYKKVTEKNDLSFGKDKIISVANMYFKTDESRSDDAYMRTYNIFRVGDIAFEGHSSKQFAYGRFVENTIGDGIVSHIFDVFRPISNYDLQYWKYAIINEQIMGRILMTSTTQSTMMNNLVSKDFLKRQLAVPTYEEQAKIGAFLESLDKLIAANQRKLDLLKEQKKGYLQKMFPKNGAKVPELRFAGFADDWEERKLIDIAGNLSDGDWIEANHIFDNGKYRIVQTGNIGIGSFLDKLQHAKYFHQADFDELKANEIFPGDILISRLSDPAGRTAIFPDLGVRAVTSVDVAIIRPADNFNSDFLVSELNSSTILAQVDSLASGSTRKRISRKNLEGVKISIPTVEEQRKIGSFFEQLDKTIDLHQRKLDLLKEQKKGFLQKMFV